MSILYLMVPMSLVLGALFVGAFVWMARSDQYEDLETPASRILLEECSDEGETK